MKGTEMKGIERLLDWVGTLRLSGLVWADEMAGELESTVDLIKREHAEDCCKMGLDYGAVSRVVTDMERHVSGAQGAEDSPVARWSRELREALTSNEVEKVKRGHADDVSMSAYDLLQQEERDAIAWVREHDGLERVKQDALCWSTAENIAQATLDWLARVCPVAGIEKCGYGVALEKLEDAIKRRLMPEGCEWPRYESGEPVRIGGEFMGKDGKTYTAKQIQFIGKCFLLYDFCDRKPQFSGFYGERVRRPAVLAADGEPLEVGQTVWDADGMEFRVESFDSNGVWGAWKTDDGWIKAHPCPTLFTHQRPVLDAEGNRIDPAMDVWWICEGDERGIHAEKLHVDGIDGDGMVECHPYNGGTSVVLDPTELYVKKPVLDADGVPIREGDTVYDISDGAELVITSIELDELDHVKAHQEKPTKASVSIHPLRLTHTKPEPRDSWERIEEDKGLNPFDYCKKVGHKLWTFDNAEEVKASDLVRRCKALAERERGE